MCPLKSASFCLMPFRAPIPVEIVISATIIPMATAICPIRIIVVERLFLLLLPNAIFFANHQVKFKPLNLVMIQKLFKYTLIALFLSNSSWAQDKLSHNSPQKLEPILTGADQSESYLKLLKGKRVGVVTNQTGIIEKN